MSNTTHYVIIPSYKLFKDNVYYCRDKLAVVNY